MRELGVALILCLSFAGCSAPASTAVREAGESESISLPTPSVAGDVSVEQALSERRSIREFSQEPLDLDEVAQLLWAAQGMTSEWGGRTAPSAGALYPLEVYAVALRVEKLAVGAYKYVPQSHTLVPVVLGDMAEELAQAFPGQSSVCDAAAILVVAAVYERTTGKYRDRGVRYVHMEAGHAAQNVYLQATARGLGCVAVGAFDDDGLHEVLNLPQDETPLYAMPVGRV